MKYRRRPAEVEVWQFRGATDEAPQWVKDALWDDVPFPPRIGTIRDVEMINYLDYITRSRHGHIIIFDVVTFQALHDKADAILPLEVRRAGEEVLEGSGHDHGPIENIAINIYEAMVRAS